VPCTKTPASEISERRADNSEYAHEFAVHSRLIGKAAPTVKGPATKQPLALTGSGRIAWGMDHNPLARFPITAAEIDAVVAAFYADVRLHPALGPVFAAHVSDWPAHEAKIVAFWRNAILFERGYDGNPMARHQDAGDVRPGMFEPWLALFDAVLARKLPAETAAAWSALAHRIGRGLRYGLVDTARAASGAPLLT
jgi:hemoglobin